MEIMDFAILAVAGFCAGAINAVAGGGTIFTFTSLVALGVPPVIANATSASAVVLGSVASTVAYRKEIMAMFWRLLPLSVVSAIGGSIGAYLLLESGDAVFRSLIPWLLLFATVLFAIGPRFAKFGEYLGRHSSGKSSMRLAAPIQTLVAVYGGYFGAGMGIMMLASLTLTEGAHFHTVNAAKNLLTIIMQGIAVVIFMASGVVDYPLALLIAVTSIAGGWIGVFVGKAVPEIAVRYFVILSGLLMSLWYFAT